MVRNFLGPEFIAIIDTYDFCDEHHITSQELKDLLLIYFQRIVSYTENENQGRVNDGVPQLSEEEKSTLHQKLTAYPQAYLAVIEKFANLTKEES